VRSEEGKRRQRRQEAREKGGMEEKKLITKLN
jgi:hypothetical protein